MLSTKIKEKILSLKRNNSIYKPLVEPGLFHVIINELAGPFKSTHIDIVAGIEARGFIFGAPVAYVLGAGFVVIRKEGNMFSRYEGEDVYKKSFTDYSKKEKTLELQKGILKKGTSVLLVDDWFETGAQGHAAIQLIEQTRARIAGISILYNEMTDTVRQSFAPYKLHSLIMSSDI